MKDNIDNLRIPILQKKALDSLNIYASNTNMGIFI